MAHCIAEVKPINPPSSSYSQAVSVDPDHILSHEHAQSFRQLHKEYDLVFSPKILKHNGYSGDIKGVVNMGPVLPPQRKGRLPQYNHQRMTELQEKCDELEAAGVLAKPEQVNTTVEYLNLSFPVQKPNGGTRLVTSFGEVGQYSKLQPSLMPNVDETLHAIARWQYIIKSDLLQAFYQIPLSPQSRKFCGIATPFKGIRVYTRCAMDMPGSETALEELMSRILGELLMEGTCAKLADDLYCGGNTPEELLYNWSRVLEVLKLNSLRLSTVKTTICPKSSNILGWIWSQGTLKASPHRISALSAVSPPTTVQSLRSFIGAVKVLNRVLKGYAALLQPLEQVTAGKQSRDHIVWTDVLQAQFRTVQRSLADNKTITLPRPEDRLWIVTDGAIKAAGLGATLYIMRNNKLLLAGFFNASLKKNQITWLPCKVEALCICAAVRHFAPYIVQSKYTAQTLTDSRPCVQAYQRLCRGECTTSARVSAFLSTISRYQVQLGHISNTANLQQTLPVGTQLNAKTTAARSVNLLLKPKNVWSEVP